METAKRILKLRNEKGWSQRKLAELIGTSQQAVYSYEKDTYPGSESLIKLSKAFDCSVDYLLGLSDEQGRMSRKEIYALREYEKNISEEFDLKKIVNGYKRPTLDGKELNDVQIEFLNDMLESIHRLRDRIKDDE
jgi:transcriptional regulator with XRE-family HTH domain